MSYVSYIQSWLSRGCASEKSCHSTNRMRNAGFGDSTWKRGGDDSIISIFLIPPEIILHLRAGLFFFFFPVKRNTHKRIIKLLKFIFDFLFVYAVRLTEWAFKSHIYHYNYFNNCFFFSYCEALFTLILICTYTHSFVKGVLVYCHLFAITSHHTHTFTHTCVP